LFCFFLCLDCSLQYGLTRLAKLAFRVNALAMSVPLRMPPEAIRGSLTVWAASIKLTCCRYAPIPELFTNKLLGLTVFFGCAVIFYCCKTGSAYAAMSMALTPAFSSAFGVFRWNACACSLTITGCLLLLRFQRFFARTPLKLVCPSGCTASCRAFKVNCDCVSIDHFDYAFNFFYPIAACTSWTPPTLAIKNALGAFSSCHPISSLKIFILNCGSLAS